MQRIRFDFAASMAALCLPLPVVVPVLPAQTASANASAANQTQSTSSIGASAVAPSSPNTVYAGFYMGHVTHFNKETGKLEIVSSWPYNSRGTGAARYKYRFIRQARLNDELVQMLDEWRHVLNAQAPTFNDLVEKSAYPFCSRY